MKFEDLLVKNTLRNLGTYINYILSSSGAIFIFFITSALINHPVINQYSREDIKLNIMYTKMGVFIISFIFIIYSVDIFVKIRKRSFGIFLALGVDKIKFYKIFIIENLIVGGISLFIGIIFGLIFFKLFLIILMEITNISNINFYMPFNSLIECIIVYGILFFMISIYECKKILKENCMELLKSNNKAIVFRKNKLFILSLSIIFIGLIYVIVLYKDSKFLDYEKIILMPIILSIINLILLKYIIPMFIQYLSKIKCIKVRGKNIILLSSIKESFISMSNIIVLVTFLFTVTFSIISINYIDIVSIKENLEKEIPFTYNIVIDNKEESVSFKSELEDILKENNFKFQKYKYKILLNGREYDDVSIMKNSDYNNLAILNNEEIIKVKENEAFFVPIFLDDYKKLKYLNILNNTFYVNEKEISNVAYGLINNNLYVVSDEFYNKFEENLDYTYCITYELENWTNATEIIEEVRDKYYKYDNEDFYMISRVSRYADNMLNSKILMYFSVLVCFLMYFMALSLLHLRFYNETISNKYNFENLKSIGITNNEIKSILSKEMTMIFFIPYLLSIINTYFCMNLIKFIYNIDVTKQIQFITIIILILNILYFVLWRFKSMDKILSEL